MGMGIKARGESFRIPLTIQGAAPTGTPQITIKGPLYLEDLVTDGAGTGVSSVVGGFEAGMVDGDLHIFSGLSFTAGSYGITAYTDTNNITIGSSAGASASLGKGVINDVTILAATNMTQGASAYIWYYDYITETDAQVGQYQAIRSAVIDGTTYYAVTDFNVSTNAVTSSSASSDIDYE